MSVAGSKLMVFPGDRRPVPVPIARYQEAIGAGAKDYQPAPQSPPSFQQAWQAARPFAAMGAGPTPYNPVTGQMATDPQVMAMAATAPMGGIGGVPGMLARGAVGAATAGASAKAGGQNVTMNALGGASPEVLNAVLGPFARVLTNTWARPTPSMVAESPNLLQDMLDTGATYRRGGQAAKEPLAAQQTSTNSTNEMLARNRTSGISVDDPLKQIQAMRDDIAAHAPTDKRLPEIDAFMQAYRDKWQPLADANGGVIPVEDAHGLKNESWREASFSDNNNESPTQKLMHRMVGQDTRVAIGKQIQPGGDNGVGYNAQDQLTHRYHEAAEATSRAATLGPPPAPLPAHLVGASIGGAAGYGVHGPLGAAGGALTADVVLRLMENPYVANRMAQFINSPVIQGLIRNAPRAAVMATANRAPASK